MPTLSMFYGIVIQMFWDDHPPPHFHAVYAGKEAVIEISTSLVLHSENVAPGFAVCPRMD
jgi:hypothetical protein